MVKKGKKSKTAEQKARVAAKQSKKATQKEKKTKSKGKDDSDMEDDVNIELVLEEYAKQVCVHGGVHEALYPTPWVPPSPILCCTLY